MYELAIVIYFYNIISKKIQPNQYIIQINQDVCLTYKNINSH
jgi:hypothetical protein